MRTKLIITNSICIVGWLDNWCPMCRPQWTLTFWVNDTFLERNQQNSLSNDLTKTESRLFYISMIKLGENQEPKQ